MNTPNSTLEYNLEHCDGRDCICRAKCSSECECDDVDWTSKEVYVLRDKIEEMQRTIDRLTSSSNQLIGTSKETNRDGVQWSVLEDSLALLGNATISYIAMDDDGSFFCISQ